MASTDDTTLCRSIDLDDTLIRSQHYSTSDNDLPKILGDTTHGSTKFSGDYSLRGEVGEGGVGRVLLGFDERIGREVAIKEMLITNDMDKGLIARFLREARITGRLEHPAIVPVYDLGYKDGGTPFYVMRLIRGDTLAKRLKTCNQAGSIQEALSQRMALLDRLIDVCEAMAYAHSKGVIHRDIKPGNIVLGHFGETIVLDWGLAKLENEADIAVPNSGSHDDNAELTRIGDILGTPAYMAPEQADPRFGLVDARSDVFALGCILYFILLGHPPLSGKADDILAKLTSSQPMPSAADPQLATPPELIAICNKALQKDPALRFADASVLAEELCAFRDGRLVTTYAYSPQELLRRFFSRHKIALIAALVGMMAILGGAGIAFKFGIEAHQAREMAVAERVIVEQEKKQLENALADVTRISNQNLTAADLAASQIRKHLHEVRKGLQTAAVELHSLEDPHRLNFILSNLLKRYPNAESFTATNTSGSITAVVPEKYLENITNDISQFEYIELAKQRGIPVLSRVHLTSAGFNAVTLVIPVNQGGKLFGFLSARFKAAEFIAGLLSQNFHTEKRDIWVVQDDGLILYDNNPAEIGHNLFREERFLEVPELRQLATEIDHQENGVGYYQTQHDAEAQLDRTIASWVTIHPTENCRWKVVVLEAW